MIQQVRYALRRKDNGKWWGGANRWRTTPKLYLKHNLSGSITYCMMSNKRLGGTTLDNVELVPFVTQEQECYDITEVWNGKKIEWKKL